MSSVRVESAQLAPAPAYVHDLLDTLIGHQPLNFRNHPVPDDVRHRILHRTSRPVAPKVIAPTLAAPRPPAGAEAGPKLTGREQAVLHGMSEGKANKEIGLQLFISEDTVKTHARRLFRKLNARDRANAVAIAFRTGLLGGDR